MAKRATTKKKTKKAVSAKPSAKGAAGRKARRAATQGKNIAKSVGFAATAKIPKAVKATAARVGGPGAVGVTALIALANQMKPGSALSNFLNKAKGDTKGKSPGPKKKTKKGSDMRARKSAMSTAQKQAGGKGISEGKAATREAGRGKVGPKRNVIKTKSGILRDKSGKAVKRLSREEILKRRKANR
jgi:hypothetical protein